MFVTAEPQLDGKKPRASWRQNLGFSLGRPKTWQNFRVTHRYQRPKKGDPGALWDAAGWWRALLPLQLFVREVAEKLLTCIIVTFDEQN